METSRLRDIRPLKRECRELKYDYINQSDYELLSILFVKFERLSMVGLEVSVERHG